MIQKTYRPEVDWQGTREKTLEVFDVIKTYFADWDKPNTLVSVEFHDYPPRIRIELFTTTLGSRSGLEDAVLFSDLLASMIVDYKLKCRVDHPRCRPGYTHAFVYELKLEHFVEKPLTSR